MTTAIQAMESPWTGFVNEAGIGPEADHVKRQFRDSLSHYIKPRADQLVPDIVNLLTDTHDDAVPVDHGTVYAAIDFALLLPRLAPLPEVSADPDGEISFDWLGPAGKMFSVSVSKSGRLSYAGLFAEESSVHGSEKLADSIPQEILRGIQRTML